MHRKKSFCFLLMALMMFLCAPSLYGMQEEPLKMTDMDVKILPEYDTSDVLVMYRMKFINVSERPYNGEVRIPVPGDAYNKVVKEPHNPLDVPFAVHTSEKIQFDELVWRPAKPIQPNGIYDVHLKYSYNPLPGTGNKTFQYSLQVNTAVDQAKIYVYQPLKAVDFMMEPKGQAFGTNREGFQIFGLTASHLKKGERFDLTVAYEKNDPGPSIENQSIEAEHRQASGLTRNQFFFITAGVVLVAFIAMIKGSPTKGRQVFSESAGRNANMAALSREKRKLRQMLLEDEINEETYHSLLYELERKKL